MKDDDRFMRINEVMHVSALSRAQIYALIARGQFPKQIKLGEKAAGWLASEVYEWMEQRVSARDK